MVKSSLWALVAAIFMSCGIVLTSCGNGDNAAPDTTALTEWQAGKTVCAEAVTAYGGIDNCFAAEPIPDGVWQRMGQSVTVWMHHPAG